MRTRLEIGALMVLASMAFAAVVGILAIIDTDSRPAGFGVGIGVALLIFLAGATIACALACLARRRLELPALGGIVAASLFVDLLVLAIWLDIESAGYAKTAALAFIWSVFALLVLGLALAVGSPERLALALYTGAIAAAIASGLISAWLVLSGSGRSDAAVEVALDPLSLADDVLLQVLGAMLVLLAAFWFGALAASRLPDQTLKRTFTTSPSSTT